MPHPDPDRPTASEPLYRKGAVNPLRQLFMTLNQHALPTYEEAEEEAIRQVARRLGHPPVYVDSDGYEIEITAAVVDAEKDRLVWIVCRAKQMDTHPLTGQPTYFIDVSFRLHGLVEGKPVINWEPVTYNPYFGCVVWFLDWVGDYFLLIYREKHHFYIVVAHVNGTVKCVQIGDWWTVQETEQGQIFVHRGRRDTEFQRLSLPDLEPLPSLSKEEAIRAGLLEPDDGSA